ncbi:MAG TPA: ABC transporter substrate-binding protein [Methylomirabilota bacterium]|nr:ABC transporter substrate-binding protein [Methylomirabilota bacterium]
MDRRRFLLGSLSVLAVPVADAGSQPAAKVHRIGFLRNGPPPRTFLEGFRQGLREFGYVEGQNIVIEFALTETSDQLVAAAAALVRRNVDVLLASGTPPVPVAKRATSTIPIVFVASIDPVATGVVASLARPGGNVTGFAGTHADLMGKRIELLRETVPKLARVAIMAHAANPGNVEYMRQADLAARAAGVTLQFLMVQDAGDFDRAFGAARGAHALIQLDDVVFTSHRKQVVELAMKHHLPAMYGFREFVDAGGLMAYGPDWPDLYRRAAGYIDRILKGTKPGALPVEQPTKFELVVNLNTAKTLGLTIPPSLLLRAEQVIDR